MHKEYLRSIREDLDYLKKHNPSEYTRIEKQIKSTKSQAGYARFFAERQTRRLKK